MERWHYNPSGRKHEATYAELGRFVVGIDVPRCPRHADDTPVYYSDEYFAELASEPIRATQEVVLDKTASF